MIKRILLLLLAALIFIQFFHPEKNINENPSAMDKDISSASFVPDSIFKILETSCYDCHSNNTEYPWYAEVQPVAWWMNNHIREGKREINFDEFASYRPGKQYRKLDEIIKQVQEGEMPLKSYTFIHKYAILSSRQKQAIIAWANAAMDSMKLRYPADSLLKKK